MVEGNTERAQWVALRRTRLGSESFRSLIAYFGSIAEAWEAPTGAAREAGLRAQYVRGFERARREFAPERELEALEQHGVRTLIWEDEAYPSLLREIPQSPPVLFVRGSAGPQFEQSLAVVGTRRVTPYGREVCEQFCGAVARAGVAIVSGLARGIDSIAHRVAVDEGASTVAVLAGGIDGIYPRENAGLAERVMAQGCVISEYPPGVKTRADYFPPPEPDHLGADAGDAGDRGGDDERGAAHGASRAGTEPGGVRDAGERVLPAERGDEQADPRERGEAGGLGGGVVRGVEPAQHRDAARVGGVAGAHSTGERRGGGDERGGGQGDALAGGGTAARGRAGAAGGDANPGGDGGAADAGATGPGAAAGAADVPADAVGGGGGRGSLD